MTSSKMHLFWLVLFVVVWPMCTCLDNGQALTPPMGWLSWTRFKCNLDCANHPDNCVSESLYKSMVDRMVEDGYLDVGYNRLNVDDCWMQKQRDDIGRLVPDPARFSEGMAQLGDYVHSHGLKYGIYATYGKTTCMGFAGTKMENMQTDARQFAEWKVDYVKLDGCFNKVDTLEPAYIKMGQELNKTGRPMVYSCSWPFYLLADGNIQPDYSLITRHCNLWRNFNDIESNWASILSIIRFYDANEQKLAQFHGPGSWNDPDMLVIGNPGLALNHCRVQMAMWCIWAAPLLMSNDLRRMPVGTKEVLQNRALIAINQDKLGFMGTEILKVGAAQRDSLHIYSKRILPIDPQQPVHSPNHYSYAFVFFNQHPSETISGKVKLIDLQLTHALGYVLNNVMTNLTIGDPIHSQQQIEYIVGPEDVFVIVALIRQEPVFSVPQDSSVPSNSLFFLILAVISITLLMLLIQKLRRKSRWQAVVLLLFVSTTVILWLWFSAMPGL